MSAVPALLAAVGPSGPAFNVLPWLVIVPVIGVVILAFMPSARDDALRIVTVAISAATGGLAVFLLTEFRTGEAGFQFVINRTWVEALGIGWHLGIDGISLFLVVLTGLLFPLSILAVKPDHDAKLYYGSMLLLMAGCMGVFVSLDLVLFFLFFELVLVPMYFLIGMWGHGNRTYAALKFFLQTAFGSAFMFVGIVATAFLHQRGSGGPLTFDLVKIATDQSIATTSARWLFLAFAIAFAVKVPMFPLHTWLPDAHTEAPTAGSVILAGILLKLGTYGLVRIGLFVFPEASHYFAPLMLTLGVVGILYGAICSAMQPDLKRVIAYSSVAHLGFIVLGIFSITIQGLDGGVVQMINHGISTPALFLLVGWIYERRHTRMIDELGGLQRVAPIFAGFFTVAMFSSIGLPGLNGFVGEFLTLLGAFKSARWWGVMAASGVILAAVYLLWAYQRVFHGPAVGENAKFRELTLFEGAVLVPLVIAMFFIGLYPKPMVDRIEPSVKALVAHVGAHSGADVSDVPAPQAEGSK